MADEPNLGVKPARRLAGRIGLVAAIIALLFGTGIFLGLRSLASIDELRQSVALARAQIRAVTAVLDALQDAETGQRGYLLTGRLEYLQPYVLAETNLAAALRELEKAAAETPWLEEETPRLRDVAQQKMAELEESVGLMRAHRQQDALDLVLTGRGKMLMDQARELVAKITARAEAERETRIDALGQREHVSLNAALACALAGIVLLGAALIRLMIENARVAVAQRALRDQSDRLQATVEHIPYGIAVFDANDALLLWNAAFFPNSRLPDHLARQGAPLSDFAAAASEWQPPLLSAPRPNWSARATEARVKKFVLCVWRSSMPDGGQIVTIEDITERLYTEAVARQAQKLESLGQLTGGVAHDFNNILQVISANLELLRPADEGATFRSRLTAALVAVERGARLTRHLLAFARRQPLAPKAIDVARMLHDMEELLRRSLGSRIVIELVSSGGLWAVRADLAQLENAVLNLALNARDAIEESGKIEGKLTIEASNALLDEAYAAENPEVKPGQYVAIAVTDNGVGMTAEQIARAVEPFYTTKGAGKGTGLGLSMVYGFAKQSGGHFKVYSELGHGTTVRLYVPRSYAAPRQAPAALPEPASAAGEVILVAEDDPAVRAAACSTLQSAGYQVLEAANGEEAMAILTSREKLDVLFTDVIMPGRPTARELAEQARRLHPGLPVVFTSGYTENAIIRKGELKPGVRLLSKPWRAEELAHVIRAALQEARAQQPGARVLRVLLVEDDILVRMTTADMLAGMGHEVREAGDAEEALRMLDEETDVLITDISLPGRSGRHLAADAVALWPGLSVILASGRGQDPVRDGQFVWLQKPYDEADLRSALETAREHAA